MSDVKRLPPLLPLALLALAVLAPAQTAAAQGRAAGFGGEWNYAVYAKDKSELPPAYQGMKLEEVPAFAIDITIRQTGNRLRARCGVVARYFARVDDCDFTATVRNGSAQFTLGSGFGGTATVRLTLRGGQLRWQTVRRRGVSYYPADVTLRRLKPGETPPYFEKEDAR
ncbi:MAG TPA: hypothetical protein VF659_13855 [Pyrinomonadaceae bacterium]